MASFTDAELSNLSLKSDDLPRLSNEDDEALLEAAIDVALGTHDPPADFAPAQFGVSPDLFHSPEASPLRATTDDQQYTFAGGGGCWGPLIGCPASPCTVGFVKPVNPGHFKNKFCPNCRAHGLRLPAERVRALTPALVQQLKNAKGEGLWTSDAALGRTASFRLCNHTAKCSGPPLLVLRDAAAVPQLPFADLPPFLVEQGTILLRVSKGTLVPSGLLHQKVERPPPDASQAWRAGPLSPAQGAKRPRPLEAYPSTGSESESFMSDSNEQSSRCDIEFLGAVVQTHATVRAAIDARCGLAGVEPPISAEVASTVITMLQTAADMVARKSVLGQRTGGVVYRGGRRSTLSLDAPLAESVSDGDSDDSVGEPQARQGDGAPATKPEPESEPPKRRGLWAWLCM